MGACASVVNAEVHRSRELDAKLTTETQHEQSQTAIKLLLLGAGESGKSTITKQMRLLYGKGFSEADRRTFVPVIHRNAITSMKLLCERCLGEAGAPEDAAAAHELLATNDDAAVDARLAHSMTRLWMLPVVRAVYDQRAQFQLSDSAAHYFDRITELSSAAYIPTLEDVLLSRARTTGILELPIEVDGVPFVILDVGGQRNERKKWIHFFVDATAVIFVASLSEYDQSLAEDPSVNRLSEALDLFAETANNKWFLNSSVILFLNKRDLFEKKIATVDLRHKGSDGIAPRFLDYDGGCDAVAALNYIRQKFLALPRGETRPVYVHETCATDTNNISVVFKACKETILSQNLKSSGLLE